MQARKIPLLDIQNFCLAAVVCIGFVPTLFFDKAIAKKYRLTPKGVPTH